MPSQPQLNHDRVDGKADPEGDAKELLRSHMRKRTGREEDTHDGSRRRDPQQDTHGAQQPSSCQRKRSGTP